MTSRTSTWSCGASPTTRIPGGRPWRPGNTASTIPSAGPATAETWGLTASDDPGGYLAHGAPPAQNDNGTITPTAAASSIAFAPEVVIPALHNMYDNYGAMIWGEYGFKDAFNLTQFWWGTDYLGIDQGPIIMMIENYLNGSVWDRFMQNPDIRAGLAAAGFSSVSAAPDVMAGPAFRHPGSEPPTPSSARLPQLTGWRSRDHATLRLYDLRGRLRANHVRSDRDEGGHQITLDARGLASGVYFYSLESQGHKDWKRCHSGEVKRRSGRRPTRRWNLVQWKGIPNSRIRHQTLGQPKESQP